MKHGADPEPAWAALDQLNQTMNELSADRKLALAEQSEAESCERQAVGHLQTLDPRNKEDLEEYARDRAALELWRNIVNGRAPTRRAALLQRLTVQLNNPIAELYAAADDFEQNFVTPEALLPGFAVERAEQFVSPLLEAGKGLLIRELPDYERPLPGPGADAWRRSAQGRIFFQQLLQQAKPVTRSVKAI